MAGISLHLDDFVIDSIDFDDTVSHFVIPDSDFTDSPEPKLNGSIQLRFCDFTETSVVHIYMTYEQLQFLREELYIFFRNYEE